MPRDQLCIAKCWLSSLTVANHLGIFNQRLRQRYAIGLIYVVESWQIQKMCAHGDKRQETNVLCVCFLWCYVFPNRSVFSENKYQTHFIETNCFQLGLIQNWYFNENTYDTIWPGPLLLTQFNFNPSTDRLHMPSKVWDEIKYALLRFGNWFVVSIHNL